ncbi:DeoR/GlpR transcriptional regulator [Candidatus Pantoea deserta]|uniref:DeoR/GlpR transcriptional regulator n=1 Tax=Candidatus Pantoea deserta TaxID=1869313 RepID=A0A3N4NS55_9GAMM|nr:DeoR/GlpR family DNA-binding transcription regulator [Pantoea deserta]RPD95916.1 DeoR/GlpR transcriptional regulator [Pantoea deserta]
MISTERHQQILNALADEPFIKLKALADRLHVSVMTIRRDVAKLSSTGALIAVRGGVKSLASVTRSQNKTPENYPLLKAALSYLEQSRVIFLDSGTLCHQLAQLIPWTSEMTAVTNDFHIAEGIVRETSAKLFFIGGELNRSDNTCHKSLALEMLNSLSFELLFLSPDSWSERGVWHHDEHRQSWYRMLTRAARRTVLLADSKYYDQSGLFNLYTLGIADVVITNYPAAELVLKDRIDPLKFHPLRD